MTWKISDEELLIEPTTLGAQKSLAVWPVKESGCSVLAQRGDDNIRLFLDEQETRALARHLAPEAHKAKDAWAEFGAWLETFKPETSINREHIFGVIKQLGVKL